MAVTTRFLPWLLLLILLPFGKCVYDGRRRAEGRLAVVIEHNAHLRDSLSQVRDSLRRKQAAQTETLHVAVIKRVPVRVEVEKYLHDSIPVPVEVVREIVRVDSVVIAACMLTLSTCEQRVSVLDMDLTLSERQTALWKSRASPSLLTRLSTAGKWLAVGYLIGSVR